MRYCHECGAEVAPEDIFCLYCGITLEPIVTATEEDRTNSPQKSGDPANVNAHAQNSELSAAPLIDSLAQTSSEQIKEPDALSLELAPLSDNLANPSDSKHRSEDLLDVSSSQASGQSAESRAFDKSAAPIAKTDNLADENVLDEDLQPTLIGQNANLPLPETDKTPIFPATRENDKAAALPPSELSSNANDSNYQTSDNSNKQQFSVSPVSVNAQIAPLEPIAESTPPLLGEKIGEPVSHTSGADSVAAAPPSAPTGGSSPVQSVRDTEANRPQETPGGKAAKLKPLLPGTILNNRYKVVRRIGGGGMGAVYLAEDQNLGGVLRAVKEMIQAYVDESQQEKAVADFRRESVLLTQLEHSSIPTIYDYFFDEANARFYLVMKYIAGGDLAAKLRAAPEGKLDEGSVAAWAMQIADVLDYLHNRQPPIVYRDLKPSNIMLDGTVNKAMLIDFGIARWVNKEEKGVTAVGTMGYAPPELFAGNAEPRSDIYSLGATMFHLLTGADPQSNPLLIFDFTKNPRPRQINLMLSVEMEDILLRAVEYNAGLRFESAAAMRDQLAEHLQKLKSGRLTFERSSRNLAQVMPIPAQAPPSVPFAAQPQVNMVFCGFCGEKIIGTDMFCAYCGAPQSGTANAVSGGGDERSSAHLPQMQQTLMPSGGKQFQSGSSSSSSNVVGAPVAGGVTARLVVLGTSELDAPLFRLEKENNLVGREDRRANIFPEVDLSKFDNKAQVSRRHARIWREGAAYMVEDLKSSNGTVLITDDNQTVRLQANQPHILHHGDKLKLGDTTLRFYLN